MKQLKDLDLQDNVYFKDEEKPYIVRAKGGGFLIATVEGGKEGNRYSIIDLEKRMCGPHNRTFNPFSFTKQDDIELCLKEMINGDRGIMLSRRHGAKVEDVIDLEKTLSE